MLTTRREEGTEEQNEQARVRNSAVPTAAKKVSKNSLRFLLKELEIPKLQPPVEFVAQNRQAVSKPYY